MTTALLDANVLYSETLRELFLRLVAEGVCQPKWTPEIHEEWIRGTLRQQPERTRDELEAIRNRLDTEGGDWTVPPYTSDLESLRLPDLADRHLLAAALAGNIPTIVTFNLRDFPTRHLKPYDIRAESPDIFVLRLLNQHPEAVCRALHQQRLALQNPSCTPGGFLTLLKRTHLVQTAKRLRGLGLRSQ